MIGSHVHAWATDGGCRLHFTIGGRVTRCFARKCRLDDCDERAVPHLDVCEGPRRAAFSLVKP
jgi:hypothetical protein